MVLVAVMGISLAVAQPPGTPPPTKVFEQDGDQDQEGLPIRAFMFLSESENQVMMPGLTWEEFERLLDLDAGMDSARQSFSYQSLEIKGSTEQERAELEVVLRLTIEPTEGRWVSIPLRMGNFHRLAPPDVSGVDEYFMTLASDGSGYLLFVKTDAQNEAMLRMRVSARVETSSAAQTLLFRLPDVPAKVDLTADAENVLGEVVGRGDEAIKVDSVAGRRTKFAVDSGGGTFSLRWGRLARSSDQLPLLEVESRVSVRWDSPQDQPIASVRLTVKNVRGSIEGFQLRLPSGSVVLESPRLGASGQTIELGAAASDPDGDLREVILPEEERQQRIDLNFDLQLANDNASATSPLGFRVPEIVGSLQHRGEIEFLTSGDYRLRWRARPWIQSELGESRAEGSSGRSYRFRFDRGSFELPLWLGEKERQLRMVSQSQITIRESIASLETTIEVSDQTSDGRLQFDDAAWQLSSIEDLETGEPLISFIEDGYRIIEFNSGDSEKPAPIRIRAELALEAGDGKVQFALPRVLEAEEAGLVQSSTVNVVNIGRAMLVVDLEASTGLTRVVPSIGDTKAGPAITSFQVLAQDKPAVVVGTMIDQPPRIILDSDATIELDGSQLRTTVDWKVSSVLDLEGRLPIRIPRLDPITTAGIAVDGDRGSDGSDEQSEAVSEAVATDVPPGAPAIDSAEDWVVTVNDESADLQRLDDDRFELTSVRLTSGSMSIRWRHVQKLRSGLMDGAIESVAMPRPNIADVTVRGEMRIMLRGNQQLDLTSVDSPAIAQMELETLPRDPIRLRLESKLTDREELSFRETILRTMVGRNTRHEQVLARIQGGDRFRVGLPDTAQEVLVEGYIDGQSEPVRRDGNALIMSLKGDNQIHVIDLRVWITEATPSSFATIEPTLKLPVGAGWVYWQIVAPSDGHVVWASPTLGRSMTWRFDDWRLYREPSHGDQALAAIAGTTVKPLPPSDNRYLYIGSDLRSFQVVVVSRVVLWICIGSFVLLAAVMLINFPSSRHPLTAVVVAVLFGGLLAIAPDAAVLAGQFGIISLVLVIVMIAVRVLTTSSRSDRVFSSSRGPVRSITPSTRSQRKPIANDKSDLGTTQTLPSPSPTEASS